MANTQANADRWLHRAMAALGAIIVLGLVAQFAFEAVTRQPGPPVIELSVTDTEQTGDVWAVTVRAFNPSDRTAANVEIEGRLTAGGEAETSRMMLDYVPDGSARSGGLYFTHDPGAGELSLRVSGYSEP